MELNFTKVGNEWVAEFEVTNHFNLHIERESNGSLIVSQRGSETGKYTAAFVKGVYEGLQVIDYDFGALVYPKFIKVVSGSEVLKSEVTCPDGEVTPIAVPTYEFVDLGLPSGTKWATCNIGATKPEESGLFFAWGETDGYSAEDVASGKKAFADADYKLGTHGNYVKYNSTDKLTKLKQEDDAAYYISDGLCRMPSKENFEELIANTTATEETLNGVKVWKLTSKVNDAFIFVPNSGLCMEGSTMGVGECVQSWSNSLIDDPNSDFAHTFCSEESFIEISMMPRCAGAVIRPIQN